MDGDVMGLLPAIPSLVVSLIQLYLRMGVNKGLGPLALERHWKIPHWIDYYTLAP